MQNSLRRIDEKEIGHRNNVWGKRNWLDIDILNIKFSGVFSLLLC